MKLLCKTNTLPFKPANLIMTEAFSLDPTYSTTRLLTRSTPLVENLPNVKFKKMLILPEGENRQGEGGLRTQGYFKTSLIDKPLITVVTVVFNGEKYLEETILSVISQTYDNVEYIIIDGGSTDGTLDIIRQYEHAINYWVSEKDRGIYDAMNKALSIAKGDWLIFIGADDELLVDIGILVTKMIDYRAVYYGDVRIKKTNQLTGGKFSKYKIMQQNICHQSIFYPKYIYTSKVYDTDVGMLADYKYNLELFGEKINFQYTRMLISRFNDQGQSSGDQTYFIPIAMMVIKNNFGMPFYSLKRIRNSIAKFVRRQHEST